VKAVSADSIAKSVTDANLSLGTSLSLSKPNDQRDHSVLVPRAQKQLCLGVAHQWCGAMQKCC
jgi:hypothetical protein